jgi:hypothetical protein
VIPSSIICLQKNPRIFLNPQFYTIIGHETARYRLALPYEHAKYSTGGEFF